MKHAIILALALVAVGCVRQADVMGPEATASTASASKNTTLVANTEMVYGTRVNVYRVTDGDVVCYVSDGYKSGGISCLKLSQ